MIKPQAWPKTHWASSHLNRNPFGELTPDQRADLAVVNVEALVDHVKSPWRAIQLIGRCGRGKTTRMLTLADRLPDAAYTYIPEAGPCPAIPWGQPLLIDEAQRLPRSVRTTIYRSGLPLVLATHRDRAFGLRRFGYQVHTERIGSANTPELVRRIVNQRIAAAWDHTRPAPQISLAYAEDLSRRFGTDLRQMERFLYEQVQRQVENDGEVRFDD